MAPKEVPPSDLSKEVMMDMPLADVTLHIDENLAAENRTAITDKVRVMEGVVSILNPDNRPHLTLVRYDPDTVHADAILATVRTAGVHAELVGL